MPAIHDLHTLRQSSRAIQTSIIEVTAGLAKVTELVLALRAGFAEQNVAVETSTTTPPPLPTVSKAEVLQPLAPPSPPRAAGSPPPTLPTAEVLQPRATAPPAPPSPLFVFAVVLPHLPMVLLGLAEMPLHQSSPWTNIRRVQSGDLQGRHGFLVLRGVGASCALQVHGSVLRLRYRAAAPLSLRSLGWGPPISVDSMLTWNSRVTLDLLFYFQNKIHSRDVKGLIIGDESRCQDNHHVEINLQLAGKLLPKEEGKGTRMTWVIGTPQPSGMASTAARGRAVSKEGWRCYGQNSAPLIIR
uniref:Uncharacterized protein n=1 Tax=Oryza glumipatula TaxID=40148 RepID=A0A0D9ZDC8_9ORYZ